MLANRRQDVGAPSLINPLPSDHAHSAAPVFVDIKPINLNIRSNRSRERRKRWMKVKGGCDQINQRRFIADLAITKQVGTTDVSSPAMRFDAPPVINTLKDVLTIFADLQFDHDESPIVTQREQVDWTRTCGPTTRRAKLRVQRRNDQTRIEFSYVSPEN